MNYDRIEKFSEKHVLHTLYTAISNYVFTITELTAQPFNGDLPKNAIIENEEWLSSVWGDNNIPANGIQYMGSGMPVQAITHMGILIKGVDANGNELKFRGIVEFSQELAE